VKGKLKAEQADKVIFLLTRFYVMEQEYRYRLGSQTQSNAMATIVFRSLQCAITQIFEAQRHSNANKGTSKGKIPSRAPRMLPSLLPFMVMQKPEIRNEPGILNSSVFARHT